MRGRGRGRSSYSYSRGRGASGRGMQAVGSLLMTRTASGTNSNNSIDDSNESEEGPRSPRGLMTSSVGGLDADNDRPAKLRRLSTQRSGQNIAPVTSSGEGDSDEQAQYQGASFQDAVVDEADAEEDELAEAEDEAQDEKADFDSDAVPQSQDAGSSAPPKRGGWANRRGKRRKGWNLRKVNKIANGVPMQTTPLRAEDVPDRPVPGGILDRLPGRRRAAHPDPNVEADLRRQLELKVAYRSVVKALKPILAELARRTTEELESSETAYKQPEDYEAIIAELDQRLVDRLTILDAFFDEDKARIEREHYARQQIIKKRYQDLWFDRQDDCLVEAQHEMMTIIREIEMEEDAEATENEGDEILPVLYSKQPPHFQRIKLDKKFYPRGKFFVETDAAWQDLEIRRAFRDAHRESDPESFIRHPKGVAVYDAEKRALATAKFNIVQLAEAGEEVEHAAAKKAREEAFARAAGFRAILDAAEMHAAVPQTPAAPIHIKQQTPASVNVKPSLDNFVVESGPFHRGTASPKSRSGQLQNPQSRGGDAPAKQHINQPGMEYQQRMYPDQRQTNPDQVAQGPVNGFILVQQQQQDRAYGQSMYPPLPEQGLPTENGQKPVQGHPPGSGFIPPFSVAPAGSERQGKQRKRPGPRAHYAAQDNRQQPPPFQPQQGWSPFSNSMGPPMYIPDYIKGGETSQSPAEDPGTASGPLPSAAGSPALSQRRRSAKSTPQMGLQPLAPAHNRGPTPEGPPPGRASYGSPRLTSPRESTFHPGLTRQEPSIPPPSSKYEPTNSQNQLPPFLQPLQPSPFQQSAPYQGSYYPQGYYGSFAGPTGPPQHQHTTSQDSSSRRESKGASEQSSRPPPPGGHPPLLLPHPGRDSFYNYGEQRQPAPQPPPAHSMMFRYNQSTPAPSSSTSAAPRRPRSTQQSQPLPPPPPATTHPPILPSPSQFPTFNAGPPRNGPLPMPRQHPGQRLGSQTLLPATLDPSRHSSHSTERAGGHSRNPSRDTELTSRHSLSGPLNYPPPPPQQGHQPPPQQQHQEQYGSPQSRTVDGTSQRPSSVQPRLPSLGAYQPAAPPPPRSSGQSPASQHAWPGFAPPSGPPQFGWQSSTHGSSWGLPGPPGPPGTVFGPPSGGPLAAHSAAPPPMPGAHGGPEATDSAPRDQSLPPRTVKIENGGGSVRERENLPFGDTKRGE